MNSIVLLLLTCIGLIILFFSVAFWSHSNKDLENKKEYKLRSILLMIYGVIYFVLLLLSVTGKLSIKNDMIFPYFLIAFSLGKISYHVIYKFFISK